MSRVPGFALIILVAVVIAAAITTWATSPITGSDSAGPTQARPSALALVLTPAINAQCRIGDAGCNIRESCAAPHRRAA
jgi:hypothetical protein